MSTRNRTSLNVQSLTHTPQFIHNSANRHRSRNSPKLPSCQQFLHNRVRSFKDLVKVQIDHIGLWCRVCGSAEMCSADAVWIGSA